MRRALVAAASLSPDGQRVAFTRTSSLCVADIDGSRQACTHDQKLLPEVLLSFSPDGTYLLVDSRSPYEQANFAGRLSWSRGNRILVSDTNGPVVLTVGS